MKKNLALTLSALVAIVLFSLSIFAQAQPQNWTGILSDQLCASKATAPDGTNMKTNPEKHTVACMKMAACAASGYGVFIKDTTGVYVYYKFDKKGSDLAKDLLAKTTKKDNYMVKVSGTLTGDTIAVTALTESN